MARAIVLSIDAKKTNDGDGDATVGAAIKDISEATKQTFVKVMQNWYCEID